VQEWELRITEVKSGRSRNRRKNCGAKNAVSPLSAFILPPTYRYQSEKLAVSG
jgi:hypothetical protein